MRPHIGLEVTPSIRLTRALAAGGMGSVWIARHSGLETDVAVKFVSTELLTNEWAVHRFADEARAAAQIKSPHVVQVHDHGVVGGDLPFIVMELLEGEDLAAHVRNHGPMPMTSVVTIVQQLGQVLDKAHQAGIVHRDVKPDNVFLVDAYGELFLKLIDFGIAKRLISDSSITAVGTIVGTPDFMCPEQLLNSKDVGPSADLWSLATVAYFALVGAAPFTRETVAATLLAVVKGELGLPFERRGIGSPALDAFFARALARNAAARFGSAMELVAAFCAAAAAPSTRTLRSEGAAAAGQTTTLEIAAGSGAWLGTATVLLPGATVREPPASPASSISVRGGAPLAHAAPSPDAAPRGDTLVAEDSVRRPVTTTTADAAELFGGMGEGRFRRGFAVFATVVGGIIALGWVVYMRPAPGAAEMAGSIRPPDLVHDPAPKAELVATATPAASPLSPPLILGGTLPTLEEGDSALGGTGGESGREREPEAPETQLAQLRSVEEPSAAPAPEAPSRRRLRAVPTKDRGF